MDLTDVTATIRIDAETKKGSVIDVIRLVLPQMTSNHAGQALKNLVQAIPEFEQSVDHLRINAKGRLTPVADAKTLVEIIWSLPGVAAREFRRKSAKQVCRLLGGDLALVTEIEARHHQLSGTEGGQQLQEFRIPCLVVLRKWRLAPHRRSSLVRLRPCRLALSSWTRSSSRASPTT